MFVLNVLGVIRDIDFQNIQAQMPFRDRDGGQRFCDFVIREGEGVRIAIEIDGYDKRGTGTGMTHNEFVDWQRRQAALVSQGWFVLRFANRDVRDHPDRCAEHIGLLLRSERKKLNHQQELKDSLSRLADEVNKARIEAETLKKAREESSLETRLYQRKIDTVLAQRSKLEKELASAQRQLDAAHGADELKPAEVSRLRELNAAQNQIRELKEQASTMKTTIWAFTALLALIFALLVFRLDLGEPASQAGTSSPKTIAQDPQGTTCDNPVSWSSARDFVGQRVAVSGPVMEVVSREGMRGSPTWINIGAPFPADERVAFIIWGQNLDRFGGDLESRLQGRSACGFGLLEEYRGSMQIELTSPGQLVMR